MKTEIVYLVGDPVEKTGGDYQFVGVVVAAFKKKSGARRYVVENGEGILHIYSAGNLKPRDTAITNPAPTSRPGS